MNSVFVHTLGDSTLDNYYWMLNPEGSNTREAKEHSVEGQLEAELKIDEEVDYRVVSHAYDGFTTSSVLNGDEVGRVLGIRPRSVLKKSGLKGDKAAYLVDRQIEPRAESYRVHPLNVLKKSVKDHAEAIHYVVISVGGNDFRERLYNPIGLLREVPHIQERYLNILREVQNLGGRNIRPILMFQYRLDVRNDTYSIYQILKGVGVVAVAVHLFCILGMGATTMFWLANKINRRLGLALIFTSLACLALSTQVVPFKVTVGVLNGQKVGMATLGGLMERFYRPILAQAKKERIPILDLPNTFNPYDSLYISQIEPSSEGSKLIAEGISHIVKTHDYSSSSKLYSKTDSSTGYTAVDNPGASGWQVAYPQNKL